jgi:hypothetical protein
MSPQYDNCNNKPQRRTLVDLALGVDGLDTLLDGLITVHAELQDGGTVNASSSNLGDNT